MSSYFHQAEEWHPKEGAPVRIADMDDTWRFQSLRFMERRARVWQTHEQMNLLRAFPDGGSGIDWSDDRDDDPQRWVQGLPLYRAMAAGLPASGPELDSLRERARHWSTCPARVSLELACTCTPAQAAPAAPAGLARAVANPVPKPRVVEPAARPAISDPGIDSSIGRPWGIDEDGFDHNGPHSENGWCPADSCSACGGYHCGWYCDEVNG